MGEITLIGETSTKFPFLSLSLPIGSLAELLILFSAFFKLQYVFKIAKILFKDPGRKSKICLRPLGPLGFAFHINLLESN